MQRLREMLAQGGIVMLAVVFALAFAAFELADSVSEAVVAALQQHLVDPESGGSGFDFRIAGTDFDLYVVVRATTATSPESVPSAAPRSRSTPRCAGIARPTYQRPRRRWATGSSG